MHYAQNATRMLACTKGCVRVGRHKCAECAEPEFVAIKNLPHRKCVADCKRFK